jgi:hypothetical protein
MQEKTSKSAGSLQNAMYRLEAEVESSREHENATVDLTVRGRHDEMLALSFGV